jgi:hypothetical protein
MRDKDPVVDVYREIGKERPEGLNSVVCLGCGRILRTWPNSVVVKNCVITMAGILFEEVHDDI